ncbi:MAG: lipocalin-like domain-containing protein [Pseudomonadota bacterium]
MSVRLATAALLLVLWHGAAWAQGFAGLGSDADGFALPERGYAFDFPADHGAHPGFRIEWWYLTANLTGEDGRDYGLQWTLFRSALRPGETGSETGWDSGQLWMAHAALTTPTEHHFAEKLARGGVGQAGVQAAPFHAWIDDWELIDRSGNPESGISDLSLRAASDVFAYDVTLSAGGPLIFHGDKGYSVKSANGQASYYFSQPFYGLSGTISVDGRQVPVTGSAWLDREWSSQPLASDQSGWDWVSLHLSGGERLMGFRLRSDDGAHFTSATWIGPDGETTSFGDGHLTMTPLEDASVGGRDVPVRWQVELPDKGIDVTISALNDQAWMGTTFAYWEGPVRILGTHDGQGYLEMTGYD